MLLFLCLWFPILFSSIDAVDSQRAAIKALTYVLYLPAGVMILYALSGQRLVSAMHTMIFVVLSIWIIDGSIQFIVGHNLFGYPYTPPQLMGMFYPKVRMPYLLAVLAPIYFEYMRLRFKKWPWLLLLLIPFGMMMLLGGKRTAWMMLAFSGTAYLAYLYLLNRAFNLNKAALLFLLLALPLGLLTWLHAPLQQRIHATLGIFSSDAVAVDTATAHRLDLWRVALAIARDHWLNGVGPRGYRQVFNEYAGDDNFWIRKGFADGTTHPHLQILEIASETGLVGLAGFALFYLLLLQRLWLAIRAGQLQQMPWLLCPLTAFFPLNAHLAFYGTYWISVGWWVLAVSLAAISASEDGKDTGH